MMKLLLGLVVVLAACLMAIALPSVPAQAQAQVDCPGRRRVELIPSSGVPGTSVTVFGRGFRAGKLVDIYYGRTLIATGRTTIRGNFTIMFTVPEGHMGFYQVRADLRYTTAETAFHVMPGLIISPGKGPPGANITIQGRGFARNEQGIELRYYLNGRHETVERNIRANARGSWQRSFQIPTHASGVLKLDAQGALSRFHMVREAFFTVTGDISLDKSAGIVGDAITMTGSRFAANERNIRILFAGRAVATGIRADAAGYWQRSFRVPEMPAGEYNITAVGEQTKPAHIGVLSFQLVPHIVLSPAAGHVGIGVTVTGRGFVADENVVIRYEGSQKATARTDDKGSFKASFVVPQSQHGERIVTAADAAGNNATAVFTMESDPPDTPEVISPPEGDRVGFIGNVMPTFEWSRVFDASGVRYNLQIATSANVTATGEFVDPKRSILNIVGTNYTLNATEALPYGTYYWIVQAVDRADNKSGWTAVRSLRVGLLPQWTLIVGIIAAISLLALGIRALVVRRSTYYDNW